MQFTYGALQSTGVRVLLKYRTNPFNYLPWFGLDTKIWKIQRSSSPEVGRTENKNQVLKSETVWSGREGFLRLVTLFIRRLFLSPRDNGHLISEDGLMTVTNSSGNEVVPNLWWTLENFTNWWTYFQTINKRQLEVR